MESPLTHVFASAGVLSAAAVCAPIINRFRNVPAASCALVAAILPWLTFAALYRWPRFGLAAFVGLVLIASALLFSLLFYSVEEPSATRTSALAVIAVAICAGIYFCALMAYALMLAGI